MEKISASSISHSLSLLDILSFFFLRKVFYWFLNLHKLSTKSTSESNEKWMENKYNIDIAGEDDTEITREDLQMILRRIGMHYDREGDDKKDTEIDELDAIFERDEPSLDEVKEAFSVFDKNCDGFIDASELQNVLYELGFRDELNLRACEEMIAVYDENKDGSIDFGEFVKMMECSFH